MQFGYRESSVNSFIKDMKHEKVLSREEERELIKKYQAGDQKAFNKLVTANWRFVLTIANKYRRSGMPISDLIQEGNLGLMRAIQKFDLNTDNKLISYAVWYIKAYIAKYIERNFSVVCSGVGNDLRIQLFSVNEESKKKQKTFFKKDASLNAPIERNNRGAAESSEMVDFVAEIEDVEKFNLNPEELYLQEEEKQVTKEIIQNCVSDLPESEQDVVRKRYLGEEEKTLAEVGEARKLSRERIRQIEERAMSKLERKLKYDFEMVG
jgi:RNA polymerase sigma factor (sigma-70 family)